MFYIKLVIVIIKFFLNQINPCKNLNYIKSHFEKCRLLSQNDKLIQVQVYSVTLLISSQCIKLFALYLFPFGTHVHFMLFDYFHLSHMIKEYNFATAFVVVMIVYYYWVGHFEIGSNTTMQMVYRVLILGDMKWFIRRHLEKRDLLVYVRRIALVIMNMQQMFVITAGTY